jgi:hypothetical protein
MESNFSRTNNSVYLLIFLHDICNWPAEEQANSRVETVKSSLVFSRVEYLVIIHMRMANNILLDSVTNALHLSYAVASIKYTSSCI